MEGGDEAIVEQFGWYSKPLRSWNGERRVGSASAACEPHKGGSFHCKAMARMARTGGSGVAMEIAHRVEAPVLMVHEPIEGVGGTMRTREAIGARRTADLCRSV